jgi:hypothetical protein
MIMWLYACAMAEPWPPNRAMLSRSASRTASYVSRACSLIQSSSVGPKLKLMPGVVVDDAPRCGRGVEDARLGVGAVALGVMRSFQSWYG